MLKIWCIGLTILFLTSIVNARDVTLIRNQEADNLIVVVTHRKGIAEHNLNLNVGDCVLSTFKIGYIRMMDSSFFGLHNKTIYECLLDLENGMSRDENKLSLLPDCPTVDAGTYEIVSNENLNNIKYIDHKVNLNSCASIFYKKDDFKFKWEVYDPSELNELKKYWNNVKF